MNMKQFIIIAGMLGASVIAEDALAKDWQPRQPEKPKSGLVQPRNVGELGPKVKKLGEYLLADDAHTRNSTNDIAKYAKLPLRVDGIEYLAWVTDFNNGTTDDLTFFIKPVGYSGDGIEIADSNIDGIVDKMWVPGDFRSNHKGFGFHLEYRDDVRDHQDFVQSRYEFVLDLFLSHYESTPEPKIPSVDVTPADNEASRLAVTLFNYLLKEKSETQMDHPIYWVANKGLGNNGIKIKTDGYEYTVGFSHNFETGKSGLGIDVYEKSKRLLTISDDLLDGNIDYVSVDPKLSPNGQFFYYGKDHKSPALRQRGNEVYLTHLTKIVKAIQ